MEKIRLEIQSWAAVVAWLAISRALLAFELGEVRKFAEFIRGVAEARSRSSIEKRKGFAPRASAHERG